MNMHDETAACERRQYKTLKNTFPERIVRSLIFNNSIYDFIYNTHVFTHEMHVRSLRMIVKSI